MSESAYQIRHLEIRRASGPGRVRSSAAKHNQAIFIPAILDRQFGGLCIAFQDASGGPGSRKWVHPSPVKAPPKPPSQKTQNCRRPSKIAVSAETSLKKCLGKITQNSYCGIFVFFKIVISAQTSFKSRHLEDTAIFFCFMNNSSKMSSRLHARPEMRLSPSAKKAKQCIAKRSKSSSRLHESSILTMFKVCKKS